MQLIAGFLVIAFLGSLGVGPDSLALADDWRPSTGPVSNANKTRFESSLNQLEAILNSRERARMEAREKAVAEAKLAAAAKAQLRLATTTFNKSFPQFENTRPKNILFTSDGGYVVGGAMREPGMTDDGRAQLRLFKVDGQGNVAWENSDPDVAPRGPDCLVEVPGTREILVAGDSMAGGEGIVAKMDSQGGQVWKKTIGVEGRLFTMAAIAFTRDRGIIVTGNVNLEDGWHAAMAKLDLDGNFVWAEPHAVKVAPRPVRSLSAAAGAMGDFYLAGFEPVKGWDKGWMAKFNANGELKWEAFSQGERESVRFFSVAWTGNGAIAQGILKQEGDRGRRPVLTHYLDNDDHPTLFWQRSLDMDLFITRMQYAHSGASPIKDAGFILTGRKRLNNERPVAMGLVVMKISSRGIEEWAQTYGNLSSETYQSQNYYPDLLNGMDVATLPPSVGGGYIVAGHKPADSGKGNVVWLLRLDRSGLVH